MSGSETKTPKNWNEAFDMLETCLESSQDKRKVVFIDEMPWIDAKKSDFVEALEYFWNSWAGNRDDIILIACGSATSWMKDKLIDNQGGLHNRITSQIYLRPFSLSECRDYLRNHDIDWDEYQIIQLYMVMGGVPFYLSLLNPSLSLEENIDKLFFRQGGNLRDEFFELYNALFTKADKYIEVVKFLSTKREGFTRDEIEEKTGLSGGGLTKILKNLERCDFIFPYSQFGCKSKNAIYRLCDFYTIFYLRYIENNRTYDDDFWIHHINDRSIESWQGFTFELICFLHLKQIKKQLGISGIATEVSSWRYIPNKKAKDNELPEKGAQIDMVIKRADNIIHLCEMKFSSSTYDITKEYEEKLKSRAKVFQQITGIKRGIVHTFITPEGVTKGKHYSIVHSEITAQELFD